MVAPPNHPPKLARILRGCPPFRIWAGDSGKQLASEAFYASLPAPDVPFGVIAGNKGQCLTFDGPNDGIVTVESTRLDGHGGPPDTTPRPYVYHEQPPDCGRHDQLFAARHVRD